MKLNRILSELKIKNVDLINEQEFETLGLAVSQINNTMCTFVDNEKFVNSLGSNVSMVITTKEIANKIKNCGICVVENPRILFFKIHNFLKNNLEYVRKEFKTIIGENCNISDKSYIAKNNVVIGNNVTIEEFVSIKENTSIGDNSIIRAGSVIGGLGFEFKRNGSEVISVEHLGGVVIKNNVEIQQNNCIDRAIYPWDDTVIGENCKTDNFVHIAHACKLGNAILIAACTCVAGRVVIGDNVWVGPGVTIINGIEIGNEASISFGSVVTKSVDAGNTVTGNFAIEHSKFIEHMKTIR